MHNVKYQLYINNENTYLVSFLFFKPFLLLRIKKRDKFIWAKELINIMIKLEEF